MPCHAFWLADSFPAFNFQWTAKPEGLWHKNPVNPNRTRTRTYLAAVWSATQVSTWERGKTARCQPLRTYCHWLYLWSLQSTVYPTNMHRLGMIRVLRRKRGQLLAHSCTQVQNMIGWQWLTLSNQMFELSLIFLLLPTYGVAAGLGLEPCVGRMAGGQEASSLQDLSSGQWSMRTFWTLWQMRSIIQHEMRLQHVKSLAGTRSGTC